MDMILVFLLALSFSTLAIPPLIRRAASWHLLDVPDARKRHVGMIPRVGGIAIAIGTVVSVLLWSFAEAAPLGFLIGSSVIVLFGFLDDRNNLDYRFKFGGQIIGAIITFGFGVQVQHLPLVDVQSLPAVISLPITLILLLGSTNAFNLLDGLDGLAAGCASLSLAAIAALALIFSDDANVVIIAAAVLGGILGFLRYNTYPAIVYMGDAGSQFLGFVIGVLAIMLVERSHGLLSPASILPLLGLPVIDTIMVMLLRIRDGRSPFSPDRNHIHHKLLTVGLKHHEAVGVIYVVQAAIVFSAVLLHNQKDMVIVGAYCAICSLCVGAYFLVKRRHLGQRAMAVTTTTTRPAATTISRFWPYRARALLIRYVECSVVLYLIAGAIVVDTVTTDISAIALGFAGITVALGLWQQATLPAVRLGVYLAAIYVSYLSGTSTGLVWLSSLPFYLWLASVALAVGTIMLLTPRELFELSTQDLLVVLVTMGILALPIAAIDKSLVSSVVVRAVVFIYACELLITLKTTKVQAIGLVATLSLLALGVLHVTPSGWEAVRSLWGALA